MGWTNLLLLFFPSAAAVWRAQQTSPGCLFQFFSSSFRSLECAFLRGGSWAGSAEFCSSMPRALTHWGMASAVFEGTSLVNMFVRDCWVNGTRRLIISQRGEEEEFFEIRTEWSDRNILYLHRSYSDLGRLVRKLLESFPEDRRDLSKSPLIEGWSLTRNDKSDIINYY